MLFSKKITDQLTSDLSNLLLTFKIRGNKDSVVLAIMGVGKGGGRGAMAPPWIFTHSF